MKFISLSAVDVKTLTDQLNALLDAGWTISSVSLSVDKVAYAIVYGEEPTEGVD